MEASLEHAGYGDVPMTADSRSTYGEWLSSTPREETEVLFHGGDLDRYRTEQRANPYLPRGGTKNKGRGRKNKR